MASERRRWSKEELLVALGLYLRVPFGQISQRNPEIIRYAALLNRSPAALSMKMGNLASLDESLERSGLRNASRADRDLWAELQTDWAGTADAIAEANQAIGAVTADDESDPIGEGEEVIAETKARRGQALFRAAVLSAYRGRCCITGLSEPRLLNASHIVPWRDDPANRLNPRNELCLSALHDRAFDRGLITVDENYRLVLSPQIKELDDRFIRVSFIRYEGKQITLPDKLAPDRDLLDVHRQTIFVQ